MTVQQRFTLPPRDAGGDMVEVTLAQLNAVRISKDQVRHGFGFLMAVAGGSRIPAIEQLLAFARRENLYPADVAGHALAIRARWLQKFIAAGSDPELEWDYARFAAAPIMAADLSLAAPPFEDDEEDDDQFPW